jgi:hypothetical protein
MPSDTELLAAVEESPRAAAAHDRSGWVGLFTPDGVVEDPVGSRPHFGHDQIGRFYDTFIGPRLVTFHPDVDVVSGTSVIRDLTLEVAMGRGVRLMGPTIIRYDLRSSENGWGITRLRAYWELKAMLVEFLRSGIGTAPVSVQLAIALLRNQGMDGSAAYLSGLRTPGARGKRLVAKYVADAMPEYSCRRLIGAGSTVMASLCAPGRRGVLFVDVDSRRGRLGEPVFLAAAGS